jgi:putative ABC transport system ATP-binding protein
VSIVELAGVAKRWDETARLAPVSLTVGPGELVVVQGRSGTGKSTLIGILAGWCDPDQGTVTCGFDRDNGWQELTVVPQVLAIDDDLLVAENITVMLRAAGMSSGKADEAAAAALHRLDLADLAERWPREISTGQRQRLAVARAVAGHPRLVLADEPTSHQDGAHAATAVAAIRAVVDAGAGALVTSHDPAVTRHATAVVTLT